MANLDVEIERLVSSTRSVADALRLKAAAIDDVAAKIAESKDPAAAAQVIELVQSAIANSQIDRLLQQAIRAARAENC